MLVLFYNYKQTKKMEKGYSISGLYYRYGQTKDENIRLFLKRIKIVYFHSQDNNKEIYCEIAPHILSKIYDNPRRNAINFGAETDNTPILNLKEYKTIKYLCQSTCSGLVKVDIGEILDQIDPMDIWKINAIGFIPKVLEVLDETDGEHFILEAKLLIYNN